MEKLVGKWVKRVKPIDYGFTKGKWYQVWLNETQSVYSSIFIKDDGVFSRDYLTSDNTYFDFANPRSYNPNMEILLSAGDVVTLSLGNQRLKCEHPHTLLGIMRNATHTVITHINGEAVGDRVIITQAMLDEEVANKVSPNKDDRLCNYAMLMKMLDDNGVYYSVGVESDYYLVLVDYSTNFMCTDEWVTLSGVANFLTVGQIKGYIAEYKRAEVEPEQATTPLDELKQVMLKAGWLLETKYVPLGKCAYWDYSFTNANGQYWVTDVEDFLDIDFMNECGKTATIEELIEMYSEEASNDVYYGVHCGTHIPNSWDNAIIGTSLSKADVNALKQCTNKVIPKTVPTTADNILEVLAYNGWYYDKVYTEFMGNYNEPKRKWLGINHPYIRITGEEPCYQAYFNERIKISTPNFDLFMAFLTSIVPLKELPAKVDYLSAVQSGWWVKATKTVASCGVTAGTYYQIMHMHQVGRYVELIDSNWNVACMDYDFFDWSTAVADKPSEVAQ